MSVILPNNSLQADYVPKRRDISNVTVATKAIVTTTEPHEYFTGQFVRLHVVSPNPMILESVKAEVTIDESDPDKDVNFVTDVDTTTLFAYADPLFPPPFTEAHVVPITGDTENIAGPLT